MCAGEGANLLQLDTMPRTFRTVDHEAALDLTVRLGDCLPPTHLARFIVDTIAQLDLAALYARYGRRGGSAYAPELLLGLLFYGYATGVFSSRKLERAIYESLPFRFLAGDLHPDHDTLAQFRRTFLPELKDLFVQILLLAQAAGVFELGNTSLDGTKLHADASKSKAVSYKRLLELEHHLQVEVAELFALSEKADTQNLPAEMDVDAEIALRQERLVRLAETKTVLEERAAARFADEQAEYATKRAERAEKEARTGRKPAEPAHAGAAGRRPIQRHRSGVADHEEQPERRLRSALQRSGGSGSGQSADRGSVAFQPSQRSGGSGTDAEQHRADVGYAAGGGPG
jgi:transposase